MAFDEHLEETGDSKFKTKKWCCICWTENMRDDWEDCLEELIDAPGFYAVHDMDLDSQGEKRKKHVHLAIVWNGNINRNAAKNIANRLSKPGCKCCSTAQPISRVRQAYEYAIHNTEKAQKDGKHLYPEEARKVFGGFEIGFFEQLSQEERDMMAHEIYTVIKKRKVDNLGDLQEIIDAEYDFQHFLVFKSQNGFFDRLCRGQYLRKQRRKEKREQLEHEAFEAGRVAMSPAPVRDLEGERVLVCKQCGKVDTEGEFTVLGWGDEPNIGICRDCCTGK